MDRYAQRIPLPTIDEAPPSPPPSPPAAEAAPAANLEEQIVEALRTCYDPEIPINIHELGLIYGIQIDPERNVLVRMTLTSPACPAAGTLPGDVQRKTAAVPGVTSAKVELAWEPPWDPSRMTEAARLELGIDY
jgi:FeS assembly SUF system protein